MKTYSYNSFLYGVVYYPEQWPEKQWDSDLARIAATGMNVVRMGEGAWSVWEPEEGRYEFAKSMGLTRSWERRLTRRRPG
jgi:beta-galactosidase